MLSAPPKGGVFPLCFASKQDYEGWYKWAWKAEQNHNPPPFTYCEDCTAEYQKKMIAEGRCENPTAAFGIFA